MARLAVGIFLIVAIAICYVNMTKVDEDYDYKINDYNYNDMDIERRNQKDKWARKRIEKLTNQFSKTLQQWSYLYILLLNTVK